MFIFLFKSSFIQYSLSTWHVPDIFLGSWDTLVKRQAEIIVMEELASWTHPPLLVGQNHFMYK